MEMRYKATGKDIILSAIFIGVAIANIINYVNQNGLKNKEIFKRCSVIR